MQMRLAILAFASGIIVLQMQGELPVVGVIGGFFLLALPGAYFSVGQRHWPFRGLTVICCAVLGFVWAGWMAQQRLNDQLPEAWETKDIQVTGVVASLPQRFERGERFEFDVESAQTGTEVGKIVPGRIMLSWYHSWDDVDDTDETVEVRAIRPGERWRFTVRLKRPHGNANPYAFDYEAWLFERNIRATGTIRPRGETQRLDAFVPGAGYAVERLRDVIRSRFLAVLPDAPYLGVLIALTVGDQRAIPAGVYQI